MIHSMTGYGKSVVSYNQKKIHIEVKALNSKALDISTRIASVYREKELELRQIVAQCLNRGKVDIAIWVEQEPSSTIPPINGEVVKAYYQQVCDLSAATGIPVPDDWFTVLLRMPDVLTKSETETLCDEEWETIKKGLQEAIGDLIAFRKQEGEALQAKFEEKLSNIGGLLSQIEQYEKARVEKIRSRIIDGLKEIPEIDYDKNRLEQELIYYIEKLDISEEKQRLGNHLSYFRETMNEAPGQGKKLGFIAQEMGREINTTGSKSNHAEMQNLVVRMKDELEQIKEQVLNVL